MVSNKNILDYLSRVQIEFLFLIFINITIALDVPLLRQIAGFVFLTIFPGAIIVKILKMNGLNLSENLVLSIGLSISYLLFIGLIIDNIFPNVGIIRPLAANNLLISFDMILIALIIIQGRLFLHIKEPSLTSYISRLNLNNLEKSFLLLPCLFPALSLLGTHFMNVSDNNILILSLLILVPLYIIIICYFNEIMPKRLFPIIILLISVSLIMLAPLRSGHILGSDTHQEYYFFLTTLSNYSWSVHGSNVLDACLSISLLPTMYQSILNISPELLFKILFSLLFSISPLIIYLISTEYLGELYAFIASFYFISLRTFLWTTSNARTNMGVFFCALALFTLFSPNINLLNKRILTIIFILSCIFSHYSSTYLYYLILLIFLSVNIFLKQTRNNTITLATLVLFSVLSFLWYAQVTNVPFNMGISFVENIFNNFNNFFLEESRSGYITKLAGASNENNPIPEKIDLVLTWLIQLLTIIGLLASIFRKKYVYEIDYLIIGIICFAIMSLSVLLPYVSLGFGLDRIYILVSIILTSFFIIGGVTLAKIFRIKAYFLLLLIIIPYSLSTSGISYQIFDTPQSVVLNSQGDLYNLLYIHDQEAICAQWLKIYIKNDMDIYSDFYGTARLMSEGKFYDSIYARELIEFNETLTNGYLYLRYTAVANNLLLDINYRWHKLSNYRYIVNPMNKIYSNGGSDVML